MRRFVIVAAGAASLLGLLPGLVSAQSPLTTIERNQRNQLDANRNLMANEREGRLQNQLDLEKRFYDEERRRREDYRFQGNAQQRALETQLREDAIRIGQQDQANREREIKQRQEEQQSIEEARRRTGLQ
jgi:hypothetical protein